MLQCDDGHFAGDYGGPMFLMPGLITVWYVTGRSEEFLSAGHRRAMSYYLRRHQQTDGGWGTHIESPSTMMGTVLSYVSLRLLGAEKDDPAMVKGREFIRVRSLGLFYLLGIELCNCLEGAFTLLCSLNGRCFEISHTAAPCTLHHGPSSTFVCSVSWTGRATTALRRKCSCFQTGSRSTLGVYGACVQTLRTALQADSDKSLTDTAFSVSFFLLLVLNFPR